VAKGVSRVQLTNYVARITTDLSEDDGVERRRHFEISVTLDGAETMVEVPCAAFGGMSWPVEKLGARAIVSAGSSTRDHAREAIQRLSTEIKPRTVYGHTGWRYIEGIGWVYLHANGAIGTNGTETGVETRLPASFAIFALPDPPQGDQRVADTLRSFELLQLGPASVVFPLFCATLRAVLGDADFSLFIAGVTGAFKSETAALFQSFFGPGITPLKLPSGWSSTANSLEATAFIAKDMLFVVDDFTPTGSSRDVQGLHRTADRLLRSQGNHSGRTRMRADGSIVPPKPVRGLIVSTGEDTPVGSSLRARVAFLEIGPDDIAKEWLTACQGSAQEGVYARTMAAFLQWLASRLPAFQESLRARILQLRTEASTAGPHRRTPTTTASLFAAWEIYLEYVKEVGALSETDAELLRDQCWAALLRVAADQTELQESSNPTKIFFDQLRAAFTSGSAHLVDKDGGMPDETVREAFGWQKEPGPDPFAAAEWRRCGASVGWVDGQSVYLEPQAALAVVQRQAGELERLLITKRVLIKRLADQKLLRSDGQARGRNLARVWLSGRYVEVLHLGTSLLAPQSRSSSSSGHGDGSGSAGEADSADPSRNGTNGTNGTGPASRETLPHDTEGAL
jgi:hypothetical protein